MKSQIREKIEELGQPHLLEGVEQLSSEQERSFLEQLKKYDFSLWKMQKEILFSQKQSLASCAALKSFERSGNAEDCARGEACLNQGKVGCLILAGGQGTRLRIEGPKGCVRVSPCGNKSLFQIFCERAKAAGEKLPLCIMTSRLNHRQTTDFFHAHAYFGLSLSRVSFFEQGMLPFLDDSGQWLLEEAGKIADGPDGNGHALRLFFETGIWQKWREAGVEYLSVIFVDNALADPFDPEFVGFTARKGVDAALKAVERRSPDEKMGVLAEREGRLKVIEYFEVPTGSSGFTLSSTGMFCIAMDFIPSLCKRELPLHLARKSAKTLFQDTAPIWKCERFLFDLFDHASSSAVLVYPREKIHAPLKNAGGGEHSLEAVKKALLENPGYLQS